MILDIYLIRNFRGFASSRRRFMALVMQKHFKDGKTRGICLAPTQYHPLHTAHVQAYNDTNVKIATELDRPAHSPNARWALLRYRYARNSIITASAGK
jgi:hypothetical protein